MMSLKSCVHTTYQVDSLPFQSCEWITHTTLKQIKGRNSYKDKWKAWRSQIITINRCMDNIFVIMLSMEKGNE